MGKYLIKSIAEQSDVEAVRDDLLANHHDVCLPHKENGCHYPVVITGKDGLEVMLPITTEAEPHLSAENQALLVDTLTDNFEWELDEL